MNSSNCFCEPISLMISVIMSYPFRYIVKLDDKGRVESFDKVIDEPFRKSYERDMNTLQHLLQLEREMLYHEQNKLH